MANSPVLLLQSRSRLHPREAVTILQHGVVRDARPHPAVTESVQHAISELLRRATDGPPDAEPPPPALGPLQEADIPTVDSGTFHTTLGTLADHRQRLAHFANESLWPVDAP